MMAFRAATERRRMSDKMYASISWECVIERCNLKLSEMESNKGMTKGFL